MWSRGMKYLTLENISHLCRLLASCMPLCQVGNGRNLNWIRNFLHLAESSSLFNEKNSWQCGVCTILLIDWNTHLPKIVSNRFYKGSCILNFREDFTPLPFNNVGTLNIEDDIEFFMYIVSLLSSIHFNSLNNIFSKTKICIMRLRV